MRKSEIALITLACLFIFTLCSCGGGGSGGGGGGEAGGSTQTGGGSTQTGGGSSSQDNGSYVLSDTVSGVDPFGLLDKWEELGEDSEILKTGLESISEVNLTKFVEWHISEIDRETIDLYTIDLEAGEYEILAQGGVGLTDLDMYAYLEDRESEDDFLGFNDWDSNVADLLIVLDEPATVTIMVEAAEIEEGFDTGYYFMILNENFE